MPTDLELLELARAGDRQATNALLERHELPVYRFGLRMCGNEDDAREVLQETLLAAFRNLSTFRGDASISTWLYQIARTFCIKQRRHRAGEPAHHEPLDGRSARTLTAGTPGGDSFSHAREMAALLQAAIRSLGPEHREVLVLRDVEGLSAEEAAEVVGIEVGALKSRLRRARTAVREQLAAVLDEHRGAIQCPGLAAELAQYATSDIDQATCERIEDHLTRCPRCAAVGEALKRTVSMCRAIPGGEVPAAVRAAVRRALGGAQPA